MLVRDHQRNKERKREREREREREIYDKELAHLWRLSPKIQCLAGDPKELVVVFKSRDLRIRRLISSSSRTGED